MEWEAIRCESKGEAWAQTAQRLAPGEKLQTAVWLTQLRPEGSLEAV